MRTGHASSLTKALSRLDVTGAIGELTSLRVAIVAARASSVADAPPRIARCRFLIALMFVGCFGSSADVAAQASRIQRGASQSGSAMTTRSTRLRSMTASPHYQRRIASDDRTRIADARVRRQVVRDALRRGDQISAVRAYNGHAGWVSGELPADPAEFQELYDILTETLNDPGIDPRFKLHALGIADRFLMSGRLSPRRAAFLVQRHEEIASRVTHAQIVELRQRPREMGVFDSAISLLRNLLHRYGEHPTVWILLNFIAGEAPNLEPRENQSEVMFSVWTTLSPRRPFRLRGLPPLLHTPSHRILERSGDPPLLPTVEVTVPETLRSFWLTKVDEMGLSRPRQQ